ncbi:MAG: glycosyltransferase [candidate division WOR-3 bacterium]
MKKILILTFSDIKSDSRVLRYLKSFDETYTVYLIGNGDFLPENKNLVYININYRSRRKNKSIFEFLYYNFYLKYKIFALIKNIKPDFIHSNDFETFLPSYIAFLNKKHKIIYDSHEIWCERAGVRKNFATKILNLFEYLIEKSFTKKIKHFITVSDSIKLHFEKTYKIKNLYVIRNLPIVNEQREAERNIFDSLKDEKRLKFVYIGPLSYERNIPFLIDIFKDFENDFHLTLIGKNFLTLPDYENIKIFESIDENKIIPTLKIFDIGVHPLKIDNLNHKFSLPNKIFQYMASSLALFVYQNLETLKIIEKYKNGFTADFSDRKDVERKLKLFKNTDIKKMKENSYRGFAEEYNWDKEKKVYQKILKKITNL